MTAKPVVFLAFANDRELRSRYLRNLPEEERRLRAQLERAQREGLCELLVRQNVTREQLFAVFQSADYRDRMAVFHYGGHANGYALLLEEESGAGKVAHAAGLADLLGAQRGLRFVFLNGCATEGHARGLLDAGVAAVLVTSQKIRDEAALDVASHFYAGLGSGASLERAYAEAKAAVATDRGSAGPGEAAPEHWPWSLYIKEGADERIKGWNLPQAAGDPLFGLPEIPPGDLHECPYRHLQPFGRDHAELFFGRGKDIRALYERVTDPHAAPILLLYGGSGVGKSSLLEAGLIPRLEQSHEVIYQRRNQDLGLWGTLLKALEADEEIPEAAQRCWQQRERQSGKPLDMILDQVEEVFTRPYPNRLEELGDFLGAVKTLLGDRRTRPQGKLVLGFRKEWLSELQQGLSRRELPYGSIPVEPLDRAGLIEAIAGPIRSQRLQQHYGLSIEDGLPESIADTLRDDPQSPLAPTLQVLLAKLWAAAKKRDPAQPRFDRALYQDRKREGLLLGDYLDQRLTAIEEQHPQAVQSGLVLDLLAYYTTARGTAEARSEEDLLREYAHQEHQLRGLIDACQAGYLLLPIKGGGTRLGHDTLAPLIRERYEESDRPGQRARRVLESRTPDWADGKEGTVLDQADLDQVEAGLEGMRILTADEQRLVNASRRERDRRARQRKLFRALGAIAIVAIIISAAFSSWQAWEATKARRQAEHEARITLSRQLTAQARSLADQYPQRSLLLAVEAVRRPLEADGLRAGWAETLLRERLAATGGVPLRGRHDSEVNDLAFDPQGRWLASAGADGKVQLWNPNQPSVELLELHGGSYEPVEWSRGFDHLAFNREGRWLAAEAGDGRTRLWDLHKPAAEPLELSGPDEPVHYVAFDPQNRWVTVLGGDGRVRLWDLDKPAAEPITLQGEESIAVSLAFDPRGRWLADLKDGAARLWNLDKPAAEPITLHGDEHVASNLAFDPQGRWLATASFDSTVQLWDLKQLSAMPIVLNGGELQVQGGFPTSLVFDSQGRWLVIGTATENMTGGTVGLWDLANPQTEPVLLLEDREFWTLQLGPQGRWLATVNSDGSARVLDLNHSEAGPLLLRGHEGGVRSLVFDPNGGSLVTGGADGTIRYWSLPLHVNEPIELQGKQAKTMETETAGRWLAMWEKDGAARIWDLSNPEAEPAILNEHPGPVYSLTFDPQGGWLAAVVQEESGHASVRLWNLANPDSEPVLLYELEEEYLDILALDPLKRWLATGGFARPVRLYDLAQTGAEPVVLHWHDVRFLTFDPRGRWLAGETVPTIDSDDRVLLWDSANPEAEPVVLNGRVYLSGFDPEGRWMVTAGGEGAVLLWDLNQLPMAPVKLLPHEGHPAVAFDPLGRWLATVSLRNPVRLWNLAKPWAEPLALQGGRWRADEFMFFDPALDWPLELTFDSQGRWLTTGSRLWDLANLGAEPAALVEDGNVFSAAFDPQGHWLAVSTLDSSVQLFSLANPEAEPTVLKGFDYNVDLAFDTKGRWIVTTSDGGATQLWELRAHELLRKACRTAGRNLTRQEWSLLLGATDYRATCPEYPIPEK